MFDYKLLTISQEEMLDLRLYQAGQQACEPLHFYGPAKRNHFLFHLILSGQGVLQSTKTNKTTVDYHLHKGSGFLIVPGQVTTYYADEHDPWTYMWIEFDGMQAYRLLQSANLDQNNPIFRPTRPEIFSGLMSEISYLVNNPSATPLHLLAHTYLFMDLLIHNSPPQAEATPSYQEQRQRDYVLQVVEYIEYHYAEIISIEDIATYCHLSRSYLGTIFKKEYARSIQEFLIGFRLAKARELLLNSNESIKNIAHRVGYTSQLNFSRSFQKRFHSSPSQWRHENRI